MRIENATTRAIARSRRIERFHEFGVHCRRLLPQASGAPSRRPMLPHDVRRGIERALEHLFEHDAYAGRAVVLAHLEERPIEEVARTLGLDLPETYRILSRGLRRLQPLLKKEGIDCG